MTEKEVKDDIKKTYIPTDKEYSKYLDLMCSDNPDEVKEWEKTIREEHKLSEDTEIVMLKCANCWMQCYRR